MEHTKLLKQWSRKTSRTVCSFKVKPASLSANTASLTHLKKNGKWSGSFLNTWIPSKKQNNDDGGGDDSMAAKKALDLKLRALPPKLGHSLWTFHWRCNKWTLRRRDWTLQEYSSPTGSSQGTGWKMKRKRQITAMKKIYVSSLPSTFDIV